MKSLTVAGRVIRQILGDRRTLALLLVAPMLVLFLLSTILNIPPQKPRVQAVALPPALAASLAKQAQVTEAQSETDALGRLKDRKTDAVVTADGTDITVRVEGTDTSVTGSVKKAFAAAMSEYSAGLMRSFAQSAAKALPPQAAGAVSAPAIPTLAYQYLYSSDASTTFNHVAPLMMGFFIFFFVFLIAGVSFLRERISGTLERLLATPVRRIEIVLGYFLGFGCFVAAQTAVIQLFMRYALGVAFQGSFLLLLLVNLLLAAGSLALGTLLSAFARNELQLFQFVPLVIVPQILFCGLFSLRGAALWVRVLSRLFPLTYACDALRGVADRGAGFSDIAVDLLVLLAFTALFLILNSLALKKYRRL